MYSIFYTKQADKSIQKWKKSNPHLYKRFIALIEAIKADPRDGIGHPEPLVKGNDRTYSRRISAHDRLVYDIDDEVVTILVLSIQGHYNDK